MCGRYTFFSELAMLEEMLGVKAVDWDAFAARYNAAPTQYMPVITNEFPAIIQFFKWGLVPRWAKDPAMGNKMINTRTESILEKPAFKNIFKYKRCIVLASGYYEWMALNTETKKTTPKQPFHIQSSDGKPLFMAGLWDTWGTDGLQTFSIITCPANEDLKSIHDRMPVILPKDDLKNWLSNKIPPDQLLSFLKPAPLGMLTYYPVSTQVNKPIFDHPSLIEPIEL